MSAFGHKQTFAVQNGMSALPPIADMPATGEEVKPTPVAGFPEAPPEFPKKLKIPGLSPAAGLDHQERPRGLSVLS
jgi:hypothetical protein